MKFVDMEREYMYRLLIDCEGDVVLMMNTSGMKRAGIYRRLKKYNLYTDLHLARATRRRFKQAGLQ